MTIKIVTDSTCDLPQNIIEELGITVVPLFINIGEKGYLDGVDITRKDFYTNLPNYEDHPTTGTPGINSFTQVYSKLASEGATKILSIHISKSLSATVGVAEIAAGQFDQIPVLVRDSLQLSTGTGFQVETAGKMAQQGNSMEEIIEVLDDLAERSYVAAGLNSLEYLRRSGRMNAFMSGLGSLIKLKPILTMKMGLPGSVKVRTEAKTEARLLEMLEQYAPIERFVMLHSNAPEKAAEFRSRVAGLIPDGETISLEITPAIGSHLGPGAIGYAIVSKNSIKNE